MTQIFSTQPYKGTRDFYPFQSIISPGKDLHEIIYREYIFDTWRKTLLSLGFQEYDASIIENAGIYVAKSGEELGSKQLYNFHDKGDRHIALRPEMTPTLARLVADQYENLRYPLRWFSIPNCFRYEQPQKGRLREHWQVNADILGLESGNVELEVLFVIKSIYTGFGVKRDNLKVKFSSRLILDNWMNLYDLTDVKGQIYQIMDDWHKIDTETRFSCLNRFLSSNKVENVLNLCYKQAGEWKLFRELAEQSDDLSLVLKNLEILGREFDLDPTMIRGQAYYTGMVFEVFDTNFNNPRSLFGGGRYDNLMDLYGKERLPAIGFGSGDVTWLKFLKNWNLLDGNENFESWKRAKYPVKVGLMPKSQQDLAKIYTQLIPELQSQGKCWDIDYSMERSSKKRWETLKKRGCVEVIEL